MTGNRNICHSTFLLACSNFGSPPLVAILSHAPLPNPGGRGLKMEVWNGSTTPRYLTDIWNYNQNTSGYWEQWIDSMPHSFTLDNNNDFSSRTRGFFSPPATANYNIYLHCDDRCELYLSNSSLPEHKVDKRLSSTWIIWVMKEKCFSSIRNNQRSGN